MIFPEPDDAYSRELSRQTRPPNWRNPDPKERYHLVVLGGGPAGLVCAAGAAALGARVALVERHRLGGDCLHFGCVPSKALIRCGRAMADVREAGELGIKLPGAPEADFAKVMERMRRLRSELGNADRAERFEKLGIDVFFGEGSFSDRDTISVDGASLQFMRAIVATGARAADPAIRGLKTGDYYTNETIFNLTARPQRVLVVGSGPIGCELAQVFARLGSEVHVVTRSARVLSRDEPDAAAIVAERLQRDGVAFHFDARIIDGSANHLHFEENGRPRRVEGDVILIAAGRAANVESLNLSVAGIECRANGIRVDDRLRTTNTKVFAVGDVCGKQQYTHAADAMARLALRNALFFGRGRWSRAVVPRCTYTDPELAAVGLTARAAAERGIAIDTIAIRMSEIDRAVLDGQTDGIAIVHVRRGTDRIVGANLAASHAGELIGEMVQAITSGTGLRKLAGVVRPYPTQSEIWKKVADAYQRTRLTPRAAKFLRGVLWLRDRVARITGS